MTVTLTAEGEGIVQKHLARGAGRSPEEVVERALESLEQQNGGRVDAEQEQRDRAVDAMLSFAQKHRATLGGLRLKDLVHEGHRY